MAPIGDVVGRRHKGTAAKEGQTTKKKKTKKHTHNKSLQIQNETEEE